MIVGVVNARCDGSMLTVELHGAIVAEVVPRLRRTLVDAIMHGAVDQLVVDLARVIYVDPIGVGALVAAKEVAAEMGVTFTMHNLNPSLDPELTLASGDAALAPPAPEPSGDAVRGPSG